MKTEEIRELANILVENHLESIEYISDTHTIRLKAPTAGTAVTAACPPPAPAAIHTITDAAVAEPVVPPATGEEITSPIVGVFYAAPAPGAAPYVQIGSHIAKGDTLCIVEAMKLMNEITAEFDGEITEILASDGQVVEFGQPLFRIQAC